MILKRYIAWFKNFRAVAKDIKEKYGLAITAYRCQREIYIYPWTAARKTATRKTLCDIINARGGNTFVVDDEIIKSPYKDLISSGVIITGGAIASRYERGLRGNCGCRRLLVFLSTSGFC